MTTELVRLLALQWPMGGRRAAPYDELEVEDEP